MSKPIRLKCTIAELSEPARTPSNDPQVIEIGGVELLGKPRDPDSLGPAEGAKELVDIEDAPPAGRWVCSCTWVPTDAKADGDQDTKDE